VDLTGSAGTFDATIEEPALTIAAADLVNLGAGMVTVEVRQIGDLAVSWPGQLSIAIS
jgi:hypothetical protein